MDARVEHLPRLPVDVSTLSSLVDLGLSDRATLALLLSFITTLESQVGSSLGIDQSWVQLGRGSLGILFVLFWFPVFGLKNVVVTDNQTSLHTSALQCKNPRQPLYS